MIHKLFRWEDDRGEEYLVRRLRHGGATSSPSRGVIALADPNSALRPANAARPRRLRHLSHSAAEKPKSDAARLTSLSG